MFIKDYVRRFFFKSFWTVQDVQISAMGQTGVWVWRFSIRPPWSGLDTQIMFILPPICLTTLPSNCWTSTLLDWFWFIYLIGKWGNEIRWWPYLASIICLDISSCYMHKSSSNMFEFAFYKSLGVRERHMNLIFSLMLEVRFVSWTRQCLI